MREERRKIRHYKRRVRHLASRMEKLEQRGRYRDAVRKGWESIKNRLGKYT